MKTKYFWHSVRSAIQNLLQAKSITRAKKKGETVICRHWGIRKSVKIFALNPTSVGLSTPLRKGVGLKKRRESSWEHYIYHYIISTTAQRIPRTNIDGVKPSYKSWHLSHKWVGRALSSTLPLEDRKANIWYGRDARRNFELYIKDKMATTNPASKKA